MKSACASLFFGPRARHAPLLHLHVHHAGVAILRLGGPCVSIARRRRFCAVAASVNSSLAPLSPRSRKRVTFRMRLRWAKSISIFLRRRRDRAYSGVVLIRRATSRACRSEEHTSELQSLMRISYAVFCLKKKKQNTKLET